MACGDRRVLVGAADQEALAVQRTYTETRLRGRVRDEAAQAGGSERPRQIPLHQFAHDFSSRTTNQDARITHPPLTPSVKKSDSSPAPTHLSKPGSPGYLNG